MILHWICYHKNIERITKKTRQFKSIKRVKLSEKFLSKEG